MKNLAKSSLLALSLALGYAADTNAYCIYSIPDHVMTQAEQLQWMKEHGVLSSPYPRITVRTTISGKDPFGKGTTIDGKTHTLVGQNKQCINYSDISITPFEKASKTTIMGAEVRVNDKRINTEVGENTSLAINTFLFEAGGWIEFYVHSNTSVDAIVYAADGSHKTYNLHF